MTALVSAIQNSGLFFISAVSLHCQSLDLLDYESAYCVSIRMMERKPTQVAMQAAILVSSGITI